MAGGAEALGAVAGEKEHGEAIIVAAALADLAALVKDRRGDTVEHGTLDRAGRVGGEDGVPGGGEARRVGAGAEAIGCLPTPTDATAGGGDAAGFVQRGDEGALAIGGPAVAAGADGDGGEGEGAHRRAWSMGGGL